MGIILLCLIVYRVLQPTGEQERFSFNDPGPYLVERVVDGDTLLLAGGHRVRLIGVNTPETKHPTLPVEPLGPESSDFTRRHVEGRMVTLKFDRERRDKFRRVLAYVYLDDWFLNEELIRAGYSAAQTRFPYGSAMKKRFRLAEQEARNANRGMWSDSAAANIDENSVLNLDDN